jgi:hypothetical protein
VLAESMGTVTAPMTDVAAQPPDADAEVAHMALLFNQMSASAPTLSEAPLAVVEMTPANDALATPVETPEPLAMGVA